MQMFLLVTSLISSVITVEGGTVPIWGAAFVLSWLGTLVMLVVYILEVRLFKKTWNELERLEHRKDNRE